MSNPYIEARKEWNDRMLDVLAAKRNWQLAAVLSLVCLILLSLGMIYVSAQNQIKPYLVEVDRLGLAAPAKRLETGDLLKNDIIRYQLGRFIKNARTVSYDPMAMKLMLEEAYYFTRGAAVNYLNDYYLKIDPYEISKTQTRSVDL